MARELWTNWKPLYWNFSALIDFTSGDYYAITTLAVFPFSKWSQAILSRWQTKNIENAYFLNNQLCNYTKTIIHLRLDPSRLRRIIVKYCCFVAFSLTNASYILRTVPTIVIAHTFCASPDTRVFYRWCLLMQEYFFRGLKLCRKSSLRKYSWYPKTKLGVTMHSLEIIKLKFEKERHTFLCILELLTNNVHELSLKNAWLPPIFFLDFNNTY